MSKTHHVAVCTVLSGCLSIVALGLSAATVDRVTVRQEWPWQERVRIEYALTGVEAGRPVDVECEVYSEGERLPVAPSAFTGVRYGLTRSGIYALSFDPAYSLGGREFKKNLTYKLTVTEQMASSKSREVLYKIFDLAETNVTDVTRGDLLNGKYGSIETDFGKIGPGYTTTLDDVLIWTGVTNDIAYRTTKLVMRKIPAGTFKGYRRFADMTPTNNMSFAFNYWISVFEFTQGQEKVVDATDESNKLSARRKKPLLVDDSLPVNDVYAAYMYGAGTDNVDLKGRSVRNDKHVGEASPIGLMFKLRNRFGEGGSFPYDFELPTHVQWMRAMRAGADAYYYDGLAEPGNVNSNDQMNVLGLYRYNGGLVDNGDGTVATNLVHVGSYRPNAYGLYDMLGNVREVVRDYDDLTVAGWKAGGENPYNLKRGQRFVRVGGSFSDSAFDNKGEDPDFGISYQVANLHAQSQGIPQLGFRVCMQSWEDGANFVVEDL